MIMIDDIIAEIEICIYSIELLLILFFSYIYIYASPAACTKRPLFVMQNTETLNIWVN
jgi:hypothetical protein